MSSASVGDHPLLSSPFPAPDPLASSSLVLGLQLPPDLYGPGYQTWASLAPSELHSQPFSLVSFLFFPFLSTFFGFPPLFYF